MNHTRSILQLLLLLKKHYPIITKRFTIKALCGVIGEMFLAKIISYSEMRLLTKYLYTNAPKNANYYKAKKVGTHSYFFWDLTKTEPRKRFINKLIKKENDKENLQIT